MPDKLLFYVPLVFNDCFFVCGIPMKDKQMDADFNKTLENSATDEESSKSIFSSVLTLIGSINTGRPLQLPTSCCQ